MRRKISDYFLEFWNWLRKILADKCGELPLGDAQPSSKPSDMTQALKTEKQTMIERDVVINNTKIHIKSIFSGKTRLDTAIKRIIARKVSDAKLEQ